MIPEKEKSEYISEDSVYKLIELKKSEKNSVSIFN